MMVSSQAQLERLNFYTGDPQVINPMNHFSSEKGSGVFYNFNSIASSGQLNIQTNQ